MERRGHPIDPATVPPSIPPCSAHRSTPTDSQPWRGNSRFPRFRAPTGYVITYAAIIANESEDFVRLAELLADADLLWKRLSERYLIVTLEAPRGWLDVRAGSARGIEKIVRSVARLRTEGETLHITYTLLLLPRARGIVGEFREGRAVTREGLLWSHRCNQRYLEAELWQVDGELAYRSGENRSRHCSPIADIQSAGLLDRNGWIPALRRYVCQQQGCARSSRARRYRPLLCEEHSFLCLNADRAETLHTVMDACCTRNPSAFDMGRDEWWNHRLRAAATNDS
jgi:hypothetical protein